MMDSFPGIFRLGLVILCCQWLTVVIASAESVSFTNLLALGEQAEQRGDVAGALKFYTTADNLNPTRCPDLCRLTRLYCDLMHNAGSAALQKTLAERALAAALRAEKSDPENATAHLCVAVCYAKNFPYSGNEAKVEWSRAIKSECETAIALDPKQDVGYYLLGRWNFGVANMNFLVKGLVKMIYGGLPKASNEEAIKNFKQAIALAPGRVINHFELAKVYEAIGENKLALVELEKCRSLKPSDYDDVDAQRDAIKTLSEIRR